MAHLHRIGTHRAAMLLVGAGLVSGALGTAACGWKTEQGPSPGSHETAVVMQNQDGDILGTKVFPASTAAITITTADAGSMTGLSSKYIAVREEPVGGKIGAWVTSSSTGSVSFRPSSDAGTYRAVFISTRDLPESVMDCFGTSSWGTGFQRVGRAVPDATNRPADVTILDGDERILTDAIDDLNRASIDRQGIALGSLSWNRDSPDVDIKAGFSNPPFDGFWWAATRTYRYVLVSPVDPPGTQAMTALQGFLCGGDLEDYFWGWECVKPCGKDVVSYLVDPGGSYRLSRQGISLVRFGAYFQNY